MIDPALYFTRNRTFWCLKFIQQIKARKVAHLLNVYFWNVSDNGFRVNDSVSNNNTVLASESNLIWILGNIQTVLYLSVLKLKKQTNQQQKRGRKLHKAQLHGGLISYLSPFITRLIFQCFLRPSESLSSRFVPLFTLETGRRNYICRHPLWLVKISEAVLPQGTLFTLSIILPVLAQSPNSSAWLIIVHHVIYHPTQRIWEW